MPGLKRNYIELRDSVENFSELPFSFLPPEKQMLVSKNLATIFSSIRKDLEKEKLEETTFYGYVKILEESVEGDLNEQKFAQNLKPFLDALNKNGESPAYQTVNPVAEKFLKRVQPFYASQMQATKYRDAHSAADVRTHDAEVIGKTLQLYALDYFLFAYKNLSQSADKKSIILYGIGKAPALAIDALSDDMLQKCVYSIFGKDIRKRMINDYYTYKKFFLLVFNETTLFDEKVSEITEALRVYCLSLIDISIEYGVTTLKNSLLEPYGPNADLVEIKKQLTNV